MPGLELEPGLDDSKYRGRGQAGFYLNFTGAGAGARVKPQFIIKSEIRFAQIKFKTALESHNKYNR